MIQSAHFDLNDIHHEPTDAQLNALMNSAATEAELAKEVLMRRLGDEIVAANRSRSVA